MDNNYMKTILSGVKEWTENLTDDAVDKANNALEQANKSIDKALFVVNITQNREGTFSADKTLDEIVQAYKEGKYSIVAIMALGAGSIIIPLSSISNNNAVFSCAIDERDIQGRTSFFITKNNEVLQEITLLATADSTLPNPYPLTFTGAVNETYDGSSAKTIEIPIGADGITPTIGDNGNWYLGATDTGKPSRGEKGEKGETGARGEKGADGATGATGADGKSAYSYAVDGGYTGTEEEFAAKLAAESIDKALYVVNITTTDGVTFSADKTYNEIVQAYNEEKYSIVANFMGACIIPFWAITERGGALFCGIVDMAYTTFYILPNNKVHMEMLPLATLNDTLPNPYPLTFTGAVSETYDGSSAKTIEIPSGRDEVIIASSTAGSTKKFKITVDDSGTITATEIGAAS